MAIPENKFIMTDEKYKSGIAIDEYGGKVSVVNARPGKDGNIYADWCYAQYYDNGEKKPREKALPWKILLGADRAEAVRNLKSLLAIVSDVPSEGDYNQSAPPATESDIIPF